MDDVLTWLTHIFINEANGWLLLRGREPVRSRRRVGCIWPIALPWFARRRPGPTPSRTCTSSGAAGDCTSNASGQPSAKRRPKPRPNAGSARWPTRGRWLSSPTRRNRGACCWRGSGRRCRRRFRCGLPTQNTFAVYGQFSKGQDLGVPEEGHGEAWFWAEWPQGRSLVNGERPW